MRLQLKNSSQFSPCKSENVWPCPAPIDCPKPLPTASCRAHVRVLGNFGRHWSWFSLRFLFRFCGGRGHADEGGDLTLQNNTITHHTRRGRLPVVAAVGGPRVLHPHEVWRAFCYHATDEDQSVDGVCRIERKASQIQVFLIALSPVCALGSPAQPVLMSMN